MEYDIFKNKNCYFAELNGEYGILDGNTYKKYDFVCSDLNLCIEFHGDDFHGNPLTYSADDKLKGRGVKSTAKEAWRQDEHKINLMKEKRGYKVFVVWESDYMKNPSNVINRIIDYANRIQQ